MMTKSIEQKFRKLTDVEHVLIRPGRYIGSIKSHTAETWIVGSDGRMLQSEVTWNPGLIKLFDEVISNAVDHSKRPEGSHLDTIKVEINQASGEISVLDNGGIPVVMHTEYDEYVPSLIFGYLRSGSNFDDAEDSTGTGQNGEGASLTNIFSTSFTVESCDGKKKFKQTWTKNMMEKTTPKISDGDKGYTKITFIPDYAHIETTLDDGNYAKMVKRVYDIAGCNPKLKIYLNGERIKISSFKDYVALYVETFEYDNNDDWQVAVAASDNGFQHVSFVNTTETIQGGTHLYYVWYQIATKLREYIQKKHKIDVKQTEIQSHMQVFINASIVRPRYDSQTKENLITEVKDFKTSWKASDKFIKRVIDSGIVDRVLFWAEAKAKAEEMRKLRELSKDIDKSNPRRVDKFSDALEDERRDLCELFLTEGDCLSESTEITVIRNGEQLDKTVGAVKVGDLVLTHKNHYQPISAISYGIKEVLKINTPLGPISVSPDHRLLAYSSILNNFEWVKAKDLDVNIHKLTRSTLVDILHAEITEIMINDGQYIINYQLGDKLEAYESSPTHKFSVFDITTLEYKILMAKDLDKDHHFLTFRYKYNVYDRRTDNENTIHDQRVP
jgi:DNA gyrase/topoisomerase IV subunit B